MLILPTDTNVGPRSGNTYTSTVSLPPTLAPLNRVSLPLTGSVTTGFAMPTPAPVPIFDPDGQPFGPRAWSFASVQRLNLRASNFPPLSNLITMRFMIGGCSAAGSVDLMSTDSAAGLFALLGFMVALNVTATAA